jgi:hypothetical protein
MPRRPTTTQNHRKDAGSVECETCGRTVRKRGLASHLRACPGRSQISQSRNRDSFLVPGQDLDEEPQEAVDQMAVEDDQELEYVDYPEGMHGFRLLEKLCC